MKKSIECKNELTERCLDAAGKNGQGQGGSE